jgi:hypothetical protein
VILLLYCNPLPAANSGTAGALRYLRPARTGRIWRPVPEHRMVGSEGLREWVGEWTAAASRRGVVGRGYHQTSLVHPLAPAGALPRVHGETEKRILVSANGNTPIIFLSDAAGPRCIRKELQ